jgi:TfoX/Sxy family transcriptional regulator of competence genes
MPYNEDLAARIRALLKRRKGITEKKMFGGLAFMANGHMSCGVNADTLMLRLGNEGAEKALTEPYTRPMDFTGRPLKSMVYVETAGYEFDENLRGWVERAVKFAKSLPPK